MNKEIDIKKIEDFDLIKILLQTGDTQYFGEIYDRYSDKVYAKCIQMVKELDLAKDLTHDILIKVFLKINTFQFNSKFSTWLFQITYTHCIDYLRKASRYDLEEYDEKYIEDEQDLDPSLDPIHEKEILEIEIERLKVIFEEVKPEEKSILLMKYQDNMSIVEIGDYLEIGSSAVKMKLKRARDKVRELYKNKFNDK